MGTATFAALGALLIVLQTSCSLSTDAPSCSPGFSSDSFLFRVDRRRLHSGMRLGKVEFSDCSDRRRFVFHSEDSGFSVQSDGALTVKRHVSLHDGHRHFSVHSWDSNGNKFTALVRVQHQERHHGNQNQEHHHGDQHQERHHGDQNQERHHEDQNQERHHEDQHQERHHGDQHQERHHGDQHQERHHGDQNQERHHGDQHQERHHGDQNQEHHHGDQHQERHHGDQHQERHHGDQNQERHHEDQHQERHHGDQHQERHHGDQHQERHHGDQNQERHHEDQHQERHHGDQHQERHHGDQNQERHHGDQNQERHHGDQNQERHHEDQHQERHHGDQHQERHHGDQHQERHHGDQNQERHHEDQHQERHHGDQHQERHHGDQHQERHHGDQNQEHHHGDQHQERHHGDQHQEHHHGDQHQERHHGDQHQERHHGDQHQERHHGDQNQERHHGDQNQERHHGDQLQERHHGDQNQERHHGDQNQERHHGDQNQERHHGDQNQERHHEDQHQERHHGDQHQERHHGDQHQERHHGDQNQERHHEDQHQERHHGDQHQERHHGDQHQERHHGDQNQEHHHGDQHQERHHGDQHQEHHHGDQHQERHHGDQHQERHHGDQHQERHHGDQNQERHHGDQNQERHHGDQLQERHHGDQNQERHHGDQLQERHQGDQLQERHQGDQHQERHQGNHEKHHTHGQTETPPVAQVLVQDVSSRQKREATRNEESFPKDLKRKRPIVIEFPENEEGPFPKTVGIRIESPKGKAGGFHYSITGPGADQPPEGLFTMDKTSGRIYVTQPLDREATDHYILMVHAVAEGSGQDEELEEIKLIVIDMNDNRPVFTNDTYFGEVAESSPLNYNILQVTATDADEEGTTNTLIQFKILDQEPKTPSSDMFTINPVNGFIRVNAQGLDKEKNTKYTLEIQAADMEGNGLTGKTKVILTVTDSNNNAPAYEQTQYTATVAENKKDTMVVKMLVTDKDDAHTPAWNAKFTIVDGDVNGLFFVETGPNKQEGIISTAKGLDFEESQTHTLLVAVENEVPFAIKLPTATATVVVTVADVNEAPIFKPTVKQVSKREDLDLESEVVQYTAYDPDTARNQKVMYRIVSDPAGWLNVAKDTGLVTVKSPMDRESVFVKNDIYTALIGAYDNDEVPATGTGTLQIKLEDVNDNAPSIDDRDIKVCNKEPVPHLLSVTDKDGPGFSAPFRVELQGLSMANWTAHMTDNNSGIVLFLTTDLDPGFYDVQLQVYDAEGENQLSTVKAQVCSCKGPDVMCEGRAAGGPPLPILLGVLAGIMLLLMMVLLPLLFARHKQEDQIEPLLQEDDRDIIYYYNEQGGGEDEQIFDLSVLQRALDDRPEVFRNNVAPNLLPAPQFRPRPANPDEIGNFIDETLDLSILHRALDDRPEVFRKDVAPNFLPALQFRPRPANPNEIGNFIDDKLKVADNDLTVTPNDLLLVFNDEGDGSDVGSLSSLNSSSSGDQDFHYLHEWGPRFKKLADMFGGSNDDDDMIQGGGEEEEDDMI